MLSGPSLSPFHFFINVLLVSLQNLSISSVNRQMNNLIMIDSFVSGSNVRMSFDRSHSASTLCASSLRYSFKKGFPPFSDADEEPTSSLPKCVYWRKCCLILALMCLLCECLLSPCFVLLLCTLVRLRLCVSVCVCVCVL